MQAQSATVVFPATVIAHEVTGAAPSPLPAASAAPNLSLKPYARWTDLPVDVVVQVMYWAILGAGSSTWATSFALTSKSFAQAGQSFLDSPWYQEAQSIVAHERTVEWVGAYLKGFSHRLSIRSPKDSAELDEALKALGEHGDHGCSALDIESKLKIEPDNDHLQRFCSYRGVSLALLTGVNEKSGNRIVSIARALPTPVCLRVQFIARTLVEYTQEDLVVSLIRRIALTGRATAFELKWAVDLSTEPAQLGAVLDLACGPGMISFFGFGNLDNPHAMLQALSDRCERFRHLKLVMFSCSEPPERRSLEALAAALAKRQSDARSRLTVVIGCEELRSGSMQATSTFPADERARYEAVGLYLEMLDNEPAAHPAVQKVLRSVGMGAIDAWVARPYVTAE